MDRLAELLEARSRILDAIPTDFVGSSPRLDGNSIDVADLSFAAELQLFR